MPPGFDHLTLVVTDLEEAEQFLGILGFVREKTVVASGETMAAFMGIPGWESDHVTLVLRVPPSARRFSSCASTIRSWRSTNGRATSPGPDSTTSVFGWTTSTTPSGALPT